MNLELLSLFILLLLSAFFSLSETAITAVSRIKVKHLLEQKIPGARALNTLKENPSQLLGTVLVGNNLVNISASALATSIAIRLFTDSGLGQMGTALGLAIGIMTFFILVFGEIIPKTVAIKNAEKLALISAPVIEFLSIILYPIIQLLGFLSRPFVKLFGGRMPEKSPFITEEEIRMYLRMGEKEGVIEEEEKEMIYSIFEFGDTIVREVMTPRPDIIAMEVSEPIENMIKVIRESGHSRIPIYDGNIDNIVGVIYAKDLLKTIEEKESKSLKDYLRSAIFIPEAKRVHDLLNQMQAAKTHVAIIVDEYGNTAGLVTLEDLIEEIVGEIHDEFEKEEKTVEYLDSNTALVDARLSISDVNERIGIKLPEGEYDTISGYIMARLGKVPAVGDSTKYNGLEITVERVHRRRITRLRITKLTGRAEEEAVGG